MECARLVSDTMCQIRLSAALRRAARRLRTEWNPARYALITLVASRQMLPWERSECLPEGSEEDRPRGDGRRTCATFAKAHLRHRATPEHLADVANVSGKPEGRRATVIAVQASLGFRTRGLRGGWVNAKESKNYERHVRGISGGGDSMTERMRDGDDQTRRTWSYVVRERDPATGKTRPRWVGGSKTARRPRRRRGTPPVTRCTGEPMWRPQDLTVGKPT